MAVTLVRWGFPSKRRQWRWNLHSASNDGVRVISEVPVSAYASDETYPLGRSEPSASSWFTQLKYLFHPNVDLCLYSDSGHGVAAHALCHMDVVRIVKKRAKSKSQCGRERRNGTNKSMQEFEKRKDAARRYRLNDSVA